MQRLITGFFFVVILIGGMIWNRWSFGILFLAIVVLSLLEFYKLIKNSKYGIQPQVLQGVAFGAFLYSSVFVMIYGKVDFPLFALNILFVPIIFFSELYRKKENPFGNIAFTFLGVIYLALPFACALSLAHNYNNTYEDIVFYPWIIFSSFMIVWANDSWAYLGGRWLGKHKLFERISPGKTWEGSIVGGIVGLIFAYVMSLFFTEYSVVDWLIIGLILIVTSTLGDLTESMLKRSIGVKDSGTMLPGHGGILDRFDGMYLALPVIWFYIEFLTPYFK